MLVRLLRAQQGYKLLQVPAGNDKEPPCRQVVLSKLLVDRMLDFFDQLANGLRPCVCVVVLFAIVSADLGVDGLVRLVAYKEDGNTVFLGLDRNAEVKLL